jgi:membrane protein YqaA with SNARE-associated domain
MDCLLLFATSLLAATIVPMSSEGALAAAVALRPAEWGVFLAVATLGNTLGSVINWMLGRALAAGQGRRWFPVSPESLEKARQRFQRFGTWSLLLAWVPWIGDPLTVAAGVLRVPLGLFVALVLTGKFARYFVVAWAARELMGP